MQRTDISLKESASAQMLQRISFSGLAASAHPVVSALCGNTSAWRRLVIACDAIKRGDSIKSG